VGPADGHEVHKTNSDAGGAGNFLLNPTAHPTYLAAVGGVGLVALLLVILVLFLFVRLYKRRKEGYTAASTQVN
jgi:hypothetical protein